MQARRLRYQGAPFEVVLNPGLLLRLLIGGVAASPIGMAARWVPEGRAAMPMDAGDPFRNRWAQQR